MQGVKQLTIAKKLAACRFNHDPLKKVDFICSKNSHKINNSKLERLKYYPPKHMLTSQNSLGLQRVTIN